METQLLHKLQELGLTNLQAKVYMLLLRHGDARIHELVGKLRLPRSSVYEAVRGLRAMEVITELQEDGYKRYHANPVSNLSHRLQEQQRSLARLEASLPDLEADLSGITTKPDTTLLQVRHYTGVSGARQLLWNTLATQDVTYVYSAWGRSVHVGKPFYARFATESQRRGVRERVIINPTPELVGQIRRQAADSTSRTRIEDIRGIAAVDMTIRGETFIYDDTYAQVYLAGSEIHGFEIVSPEFTTTQRSVFETLWQAASPLEP